MADLHLRPTDEQLAALRNAAEREGATSSEDLAEGSVAEGLADYGIANEEWSEEALAPDQRERLEELIEEGLASPSVPYDPQALEDIFRRVACAARLPQAP